MRMLAVLLGLALSAAPALAAMIASPGSLMTSSTGTSTGNAPASCSNALDFSDGCNSQYIPVIF